MARHPRRIGPMAVLMIPLGREGDRPSAEMMRLTLLKQGRSRADMRQGLKRIISISSATHPAAEHGVFSPLHP